jgi:threonine synthase
MNHYRCRTCGTDLPVEPKIWRCPCGGLLDLPLDVPVDALAGAGAGAGARPWSLWRYRAALPFAPGSTIPADVSLGEGMTPLVDAGDGVLVKLDFLMPTLSYKDRGAVVLVAKAAELGVRHLVADSSGNAGTAIAAYAARAGITAEVFVPGDTSAKKLAQLGGYGAVVRPVEGSRQRTAEAAIERIDGSGAFYASHVYNPHFHHGTKTFAYEVFEQLGGRVPGTVVVPAGNGTLLIGAAVGFGELVAAGRAGTVPRLVAVQAERCAPLAAAWAGEAPAAAGPTVAEGIAIERPARLEQMVEVVAASGGAVITAEEASIPGARRELAGRGIDVEPTAAATWAAWRAWSGAGATPGPVVLALTGAGSKSPAEPADRPRPVPAV